MWQLYRVQLGSPSNTDITGHCFERPAVQSAVTPTNCINPSSTHYARRENLLYVTMPRPCLKLQDPAAEPLSSNPRIMLSLHVHFPPTPSLSSIHTTHSSRTYDRAPIAISPNVCALPERGGRTYTPASESSPKPRRKGGYFHPEAFDACETEPIDDHIPASPPLRPPPLTPDLSSDSDESDGVGNTLPHHSGRLSPILLHFAQHTQSPTTSFSRSKDMLLDSQLSFLPHPPSSAKSKDGVRKRRRSPSCPRLGKAHDINNGDAFEQPSLDGCLGGF